MRLSKLKVILNHPGIHELLLLHRADALATGKNVEHVEFCERLLREWTTDDLNPHALITGYDLMKMGIEQGPFYKTLLDAVREAQLDDAIKTHDEALGLVRRLMAEKGNT
jgi:poly(A) polymerase